MPFDTEHVNCRFAAIDVRQMEHDDAEIPLVEITLEINPLTASLAAELDGEVKAMLFSRADEEIKSKVRRVVFDLPIRPQSIAVRSAPDQGEASYVIDEAKVTHVVVTRTKKSSAWTLRLKVLCSPSSADQLQQIVESYLKAKFCTFANATPGLFDEVEKDERKKKAPVVRGQRVSDVEAVAH